MENALKSISEKTRSFLLRNGVSGRLAVRCALVAATWALTPYLVFAGVSIYVYLVPLFRPGAFILSFLVFLALGSVASGLSGAFSIWIALLIGAALYLLLGVKDLVFVRREAAVFVFELILVSGIFFAFFWFVQPALFGITTWSVTVLVALFVLFMEYFSALLPEERRTRARAAAIVCAFIVFQLMWAVTLLPLNALHAALVLVVVTMALFDLVGRLLRERLSQQRLFGTLLAAGALIALVFSVSRWSI